MVQRPKPPPVCMARKGPGVSCCPDRAPWLGKARGAEITLQPEVPK